MDLTYPEEAEQFRTEIRAWLDENLPSDWGDREMSSEEKAEFSKRWNEKLFEGGWICASWPTEYGGKGLTTMQNVVLHEELARAGAPMRGDFFGDTLVGPPSCSGGPRSRSSTSCPASSRVRSPGARGSPNRTPVPTWPASSAGPSSMATSGSSTDRRCGPPRPNHARLRAWLDVLGLDGQILTGDPDQDFVPGIGKREAARDCPVTPLQAAFFFSRSETIWGGTAEIQRNIVGERVLGLPKEPKPENELSNG